MTEVLIHTPSLPHLELASTDLHSLVTIVYLKLKSHHVEFDTSHIAVSEMPVYMHPSNGIRCIGIDRVITQLQSVVSVSLGISNALILCVSSYLCSLHRRKKNRR